MTTLRFRGPMNGNGNSKRLTLLLNDEGFVIGKGEYPHNIRVKYPDVPTSPLEINVSAAEMRRLEQSNSHVETIG